MDRTQVAWLVGALGLFALLVFGVVGIIFPFIGHMKRQDMQRESASVISPGKWKRFYSGEGKFSVRFPGTPQLTNVTQDVAGFNLVQPLFYVWSDPQTEYAVNYTDYKGTPAYRGLQKLSPEQQFDITEAGIANDIGEVSGNRDFQLDGYPARDFEYIAGGKANYSGKETLVLVDGRLYQVMVIYFTGSPHPDDFKLFFSSFSLAGTNSQNSQ